MNSPQFFLRAHAAGFSLPNLKEPRGGRETEGTSGELTGQGSSFFPNSECLILDGKKLSDNLIAQCKAKYAGTTTTKPNLAVILVGDNPASQVYVKNKIKTFEKANFKSELIQFSNEDATQDKIINCISKLNKDSKVHGILLQLPLPEHLNTEKILKEIAFQKDVDGFSAENIGSLVLNDNTGTVACTPFGIMILLSAYGINPSGKHCVVVGRSSIVGKPIGLLLLNANATVTFVHTQSKDISSYTQTADILIVAAGKKHLIHKEHIKSGVIIVDVGIHKNKDNTLSGDVHPNVQDKAAALTPVPGGVGPMTIASLLLNTAMAKTLQ